MQASTADALMALNELGEPMRLGGPNAEIE